MPKSGTQRGKRLPAKRSDVQQVEVVKETIQLSVSQANDLRNQIKKLHTGMNLGCVELGKMLTVVCDGEVKDKGRVYRTWGFDSFQNYCERELGMSRSKGYDLICLSRQSDAGILSPKEVESIGWAKVVKLLPLINDGSITKQNISKWLKTIEDKSFEEVRKITHLAQLKAQEKRAEQGEDEEVEEEEVEDEEDAAGVTASTRAAGKSSVVKQTSAQISPEEVYNLHVPLYKDQWANAQLALKKAENVTGSDKIPWLMDCIFTNFLSEGFSTKEQALEVMCQRIERAFSVKLIAMHDKSQQVVFGERIVKLLQASGKREK